MSHSPESKNKMGSIRQGFGEGLVYAGTKNKSVVALCADLSESLAMTGFKEMYPERFFQMGVAEQNLVTVASGMASMGKIPFVGSYAVFSPGRNWEQIRTTICYNDQSVKIVGSHTGLNVGPDGGSHQALEDIALMRALPRMIVLSPCDQIEAKKATILAAETGTPVYLRLPREKSPILTNEDDVFELGKASILAKPSTGKKSDVGIICTGSICSRALEAVSELDESGINCTLVNLSTIKPLDENAIIKLAHETGAIVTIEEHQVSGGMGSAVAEFLAQNMPVPMEIMGVKDQFGQSGTADELLDLYGFKIKDIVSSVKKVILRKKK